MLSHFGITWDRKAADGTSTTEKIRPSIEGAAAGYRRDARVSWRLLHAGAFPCRAAEGQIRQRRPDVAPATTAHVRRVDENRRRARSGDWRRDQAPPGDLVRL